MSCGGRVYKGDLVIVSIHFDVSGYTNLSVDYFTTGVTKITKSEDELTVEDGFITCSFAGHELDILPDGVIRYTITYQVDGEDAVESSNTMLYLKTPESYSAKTIDEISEEAYQSGYTSGYQSGYTNGYSDGHTASGTSYIVTGTFITGVFSYPIYTGETTTFLFSEGARNIQINGEPIENYAGEELQQNTEYSYSLIIDDMTENALSNYVIVKSERSVFQYPVFSVTFSFS